MLNLLAGTFWETYGMIIILVIFIAIIVVFYILSSRKRKKQEQEAKDLIDAVKPGNKVKTIGGICGIVVEVDSEENTFVLETGTEKSGKSYIKFDRQAIYQTDAVVEKEDNSAAAKNEEENVSEGAVEEVKAEETASSETVSEEATAENDAPEMLRKKK